MSISNKEEMQHKPTIIVDNLSIGYASRHGSCHAVGQQLRAEAYAGTLTCLIGRNGTGKSTLLRTIARLQAPLDGHVLICGHDANSYSTSEMARLLGIVLTSRPDVSNLTVRELVALGRAPYTGFWGKLADEDRRIVDESMRRAGISGMEQRRVCSLSDGECQKAMVAKALAQQTPIILLDEPTAFLDYPGKIDLLLLLRQLAHDEGKTILLSTHDIDTALQIADRLWLLDSNGISAGTTGELAAKGRIERYVGRDDVVMENGRLVLKKSTL